MFAGTILVILSLLCVVHFSIGDPSHKQVFEFTLVHRINQTGHTNVHFSLTQDLDSSRKNWKANVKNEIITVGKIQTRSVQVFLSDPPPKPKDYIFFPGIGYYKFHDAIAKFHDAISICSDEGGHLAILNSQEEANALKTLYARYPDSWKWAIIGFYDYTEKENYRTIFGKELKETGYNVWHPSEPDHSYGRAYCGVMNREGLLGAGTCKDKRPFICEYDLTWAI